MLKIGKGLKKKIKGKKSKHEDDLFDPEQLAKYRQELEEAKKAAAAAAGDEGDLSDENEAHHPETSDTGHEEDEEWLKFKQLTGGVDDILKKASTDLDRIKETTYYQKPQAPEPIVVVPTKAQKAPKKYHSNTTFDNHVGVSGTTSTTHVAAASSSSAENKQPHWQVNFVGDEIVEENDVEEESEPEPVKI